MRSRTKAEELWYKENPQEWERGKNAIADEILLMYTKADFLTLVNNSFPTTCRDCGLPNVSEVRGIPADMLKEIINEWKAFKEKANADL